MVLAVGSNPSLMTNRTLVLQAAGYVVIKTYSLEDADAQFQAGDFDWILLCHSVTAVDRERLTSFIRASGSRIPVISIAENLGECDAFANATLEDGPNKFLAGVREVLSKAAKTSAA
jgi:CheY-like chemotaxis protein